MNSLPRFIRHGARLAAGLSILWPRAGLTAQTPQRPAYDGVAEAAPVDVDPPGVNCAAAPGRCFRIHYVTSTAHAPALVDASPANGVPDYVYAVRGVLLEVYQREIAGMGWAPPPTDAGSASNGGNGRYDVYVANVRCDQGIAYVQPEGAVSPGSDSWYSFMVLGPNLKACYDDPSVNAGPGDLSTLEAMDVVRDVIAHEFHHAVQFGIDGTASDALTAFREATSNWMNDEAYDSINANVRSRQLGDFTLFTDPAASLETVAYGGWFWLRYLSERFGRNVVREIWRQLATANHDPVSATETVLVSRGVTLAGAWTDFAGKLLARDWFEEGATYPDLLEFGLANAASPHAAFPLGVQNVTVDHLTRRYFVFNPPAGTPAPRVLRMLLDGPDAQDVGAVLVAYTADGRAIDIPVVLDANRDGSVTVSGFGSRPPPASEFSRVTSMVLVLTNGTRSSDGLAFSYCRPQCEGVAGADPAIVPWGAVHGYRPPLWRTPDVWVDNDGDCAPDVPGQPGCNELADPATPADEPARGRTNTLFARIRNLGDTASDRVAVHFRYGPCGPGYTPASYAEIGTRVVSLAAAGDPAGNDVRTVSIPWDLADLSFNNGGAWDVPGTPAVETIRDFDQFCIRVTIDAPGDVNGANNDALSNFGNVPVHSGPEE